MKKSICILLALMLALALLPAVSGNAEITVQQIVISARSVYLNEEANTLAVMNEDKKYQVMNADGEILSDSYLDITVRSGMYKVTAGGKEYSIGLLDGQGNQMIPCDYADVQVYSDRWQAGINVKEATAENYDIRFYSYDGPDRYCLVDTVDVYYRGSKVGSFDRMDFDDATAYGDYLCVTDRERERTFFDKELKPSPRAAEYSGEFEEDRNAVYHQGSGQQAFVPECTLTEDEVVQHAWVQKGKVLDLQGNVIGDVSSYASVYRPDGELIKVRNGADLYGLVNLQGEEVLPCMYSEISYDLEIAGRRGYVSAVRDGKAGFVNLSTGAETGFVYAPDVVREYSGFMKVTDLDGTVILISTAAGKLPEQYADVQLRSEYSGTCMLAAVQDAKGNAGVIGQYGEPVIALDGTYTQLYNIELSNDGTVAVGTLGNRKYSIYRIDYQPADEGSSAGTEDSAAEEGWTCENGHGGNTGKFCSECGAPRPEKKTDEWTCSQGHGGNTGKFCSECGEPRPADTGEWTCSQGHSGNTGKFCGECGEPRP